MSVSFSVCVISLGSQFCKMISLILIFAPCTIGNSRLCLVLLELKNKLLFDTDLAARNGLASFRVK
jgi:hypothetical protein